MTTKEIWNKIYIPESGEDIWEYIEQAMKEYARIKCLETAKNVRYKAIDILQEYSHYTTLDGHRYINLGESQKKIQNIRNQDVIPEL